MTRTPISSRRSRRGQTRGSSAATARPRPRRRAAQARPKAARSPREGTHRRTPPGAPWAGMHYTPHASVSPESAHRPPAFVRRPILTDVPGVPRPRMFDSLSDRLRKTLAGLTGRGRVTEADLEVAMREVRLALLEADVNFKVVKDFVARVRERALGA